MVYGRFILSIDSTHGNTMLTLYKNYSFLLLLLPFIAIVILIIALTSCTEDNFDTIINKENNAYNDNNYINSSPIPGNNGLIIVTNITENSAKLQWSPATDNSPSETLQYQVVVSRTLTLFSLEEILQSGLLDENNWSSNLVNEYTITGLLYGKQYFVNVCVRDPDNNISIYYPATFTTIGRIYLFSAGTYTGAMALASHSARNEINELVHNALINYYSSLPQDNYVAFISIDTTDAIKDLPYHYGIPINWAIYSPTDKKIADNFYALLMKDDIPDTLANLGVCDTVGWWSGSNEYGAYDSSSSNCSRWTSEDTKGRTGAHNKKDKQWIMDNNNNCHQRNHLLGLCW